MSRSQAKTKPTIETTLFFSRTNESITCRDRQTSETCSGLIGWSTLDRSLIANQTRDWDNTVYSSRIRSQWTNLSRDAIDRPVSLCGRLIVWRPRADHWTDRWSAAADCDCDRGDCLPIDLQSVPTPHMAGVHSCCVMRSSLKSSGPMFLSPLLWKVLEADRPSRTAINYQLKRFSCNTFWIYFTYLSYSLTYTKV